MDFIADRRHGNTISLLTHSNFEGITLLSVSKWVAVALKELKKMQRAV